MKDILYLGVILIAAITLAACGDDKKKASPKIEDRTVWFQDDDGRKYFRPVDMEKIEAFEGNGVPVDKDQADIYIKEMKEDQEKIPDYVEVYSHTPDHDFQTECVRKAGVVRKIHGGKWACRYPARDLK